MIDPMADLAGGGPDMSSMMGGASSNPDDNNQEVFDMDAFRYNFRKMDKMRSFMGIVAGCVAGILGLTGLSGLGECFAISLFEDDTLISTRFFM
jgi:hypothetical protein